jgi:hypothetical protein
MAIKTTPSNQPQYPIYIPTKGRYHSQKTIKALDRIGVPYIAVVEEQEFDLYAAFGVPEARLLVLPHRDKGLIPTRNWIWDHAQASGVKRFWTMDDNIMAFFRLNRNTKYKFADGTFLRIMEEFTDRYLNVVISGMHYHMFLVKKREWPPLYINHRVYSNMLLATDYRDPRGKPYRNEMELYNDDTDLNLRVLKDGNCTLLFNAFLAQKAATMSMKGGMAPYYQTGMKKEDDGRWKATNELYQKHPDCVKIIRRWGRWHHYVDYSRFATNKLILRPGVQIPTDVNDYGMRLIPRKEERIEA